MWLQNGNLFQTRDPGSDIPKLPPHVYTISASMTGVFLQKQQDSFQFPYKVYGGMDFPKRVEHHYKSTTGNLGVMLTGLKGTGKTVEAEQICNLLGLPVILVTENFDGLVPFLNRIPEDIVVFIDEYEKLFEKSNALLSLMDGALRTQHRRIFLLTTNDTYVSSALMNRPSRIFYVKCFGNLSGEMIAEIVQDMISDSRMQQAAITYLATLDIITVDIVKAVCAEMLRFNEVPDNFKDLLNVETRYAPYKTVHHLSGDKEICIGKNARIDPHDPFMDQFLPNSDDCGYTFSIADGENSKCIEYGEIQSFDKLNGLLTTTQGVFRITESSVHPSLTRYVTV